MFGLNLKGYMYWWKIVFAFVQNAYTATAINSTNFCTSAKDAFVILVENALRVAAINTVGDFMLFLGKVRRPSILCQTDSKFLHMCIVAL